MVPFIHELVAIGALSLVALVGFGVVLFSVQNPVTLKRKISFLCRYNIRRQIKWIKYYKQFLTFSHLKCDWHQDTTGVFFFLSLSGPRSKCFRSQWGFLKVKLQRGQFTAICSTQSSLPASAGPAFFSLFLCRAILM